MKVYKISRFHSEFFTPDGGVALKALKEVGQDKPHVTELEFRHNRLWRAEWVRILTCKCGEAIVDRIGLPGVSLPIYLRGSYGTIMVPSGQPLDSEELSGEQKKALKFTMEMVSDGKAHHITT